ncbi:MAG: NADAR family protein [Bacteroidota bacterium]
MQSRRYKKSEVITFRSTKGKYGGLSNMAPAYSVFVNSTIIPTIEALYQACRFPHLPDIQFEIINQNSPMTAKKVSREHTEFTREDWEEHRIQIMRWCLQIKLSQNFDSFSELLLSTGDKPIVEYTKKDKIWGATDEGNGYLEGVNALGRLLMELREQIKEEQDFECIDPLEIENFLLFENQIEKVCIATTDVFDLLMEEEEDLLIVV